jgi:hypothetical protein
MRKPLLSLAAVALLVGCPGYVGVVDGGPEPPDPPDPPDVITAADIGVLCEYDAANASNPTNQCARGLTCLIRTFDGAFSPFPAGDPRNLSLGVWEDHFTVYRDDGIDEGYCTLVAETPQVPACPAGTEAKFLAPAMSICVRSCQTPAECGRLGYTCDSRYLDVGTSCVRQCTLDLPDCVRSGHVQRPDGSISMHLFEGDLRGESTCDLASGLCAVNPGEGVSETGEACNTSLDCAAGLMCLQSDVLAASGAPVDSPGVCSRPCKPGTPNDPQSMAGQGCLGPEVCQGGFTFGHGNPLDPNLNDANGFLAIIPPDQLVEAGGWCFPECETNAGDCTGTTGTQCGSANDGVFGLPWNGISMCLPGALRQGG